MTNWSDVENRMRTGQPASIRPLMGSVYAPQVTVEVDVVRESVPSAQLAAVGLGLEFQVVTERGPGGGQPVARVAGPRRRVEDWLHACGYVDPLATYAVTP